MRGLPKPKWLILAMLVLFGIGTAVLVVVAYRHTDTLGASLNIQAAPQDAVITLDGRTVGPGLHSVRPQPHTVTFTRAGFTSSTQEISVDRSQTRFVGAALIPNTTDNADWYAAHSEDARQAEGISSQMFDQHNVDALKIFPIISQLPIQERNFRIDYGVSQHFSRDSGVIALYIQAVDGQAVQDALGWMKTYGYQPVDYEIIYTVFTTPPQVQRTTN